jgi:hypothetical protein
MSIYDSSLPIRTENNSDVVAAISDKLVPSRTMTVNADGSINVNASATDLDIRDLDAAQDNIAISDGTDTLAINADGSINSVVSATDLDIRDLNSATDSVTVVATNLDVRDLSHTQDSVKLGDGTDFVAVNADGSLNITDNGGSLTVDATNLDIRDLNHATDSVTSRLQDGSGNALSSTSGALNVQIQNTSIAVTATDLDIRNLSASQDNLAISDGTDTMAVNADGSINSVVSATDFDIRDLSHSQDSIKIGDGTDFLAVNADGSINVIVSQNVPGTEVLDYKAASAVAAAASDTHSYTVTALKTLHLQQIVASASGKMQVEIKLGGTTKAMLFNSTANPNVVYEFKAPQYLAAGTVVSVVLTNLDKQANDLFSTIEGVEN